MGMLVSFYRDAGSDYDCSRNGESVRFVECCVVNVDGPFEPYDDRPPMMLVDDLPTGKPYPKVVPAELVDGAWERKPGWIMFGGNYAGTSDSRFCRAVDALCGVRSSVVPVFDRVES